MRILYALFLLALAAFYAYGILATFEPMEEDALPWRLGYGMGIVLCLYGVRRVLRPAPEEGRA